MSPDLLVCGIDRSRGSERALRYAARLASEIDAHVLAVHVDGESPSPDLARRVAELAAGLQADIGFHAVRATPAEGLEATARVAGADLLAVGHTALHAAAGVLGPTVGRLSRESARPVLVVPENDATGEDGSVDGIVCCIGPDADDVGVGAVGVELAQWLQVGLTLVHAAENATSVIRAVRALARVAAAADAVGVACRFHMASGATAERLADAAGRLHAPLLVVATDDAGRPKALARSGACNGFGSSDRPFVIVPPKAAAARRHWIASVTAGTHLASAGR